MFIAIEFTEVQGQDQAGPVTIRCYDSLISKKMMPDADSSLVDHFCAEVIPTAHAILMCFSNENIESLISLKDWVNTIKDYLSPETHIYLVGTKCDTRKRLDDQVYEVIGKQLGSLEAFFNTSSVTGENVEKLFGKILNKCVKLPFIVDSTGQAFNMVADNEGMITPKANILVKEVVDSHTAVQACDQEIFVQEKNEEVKEPKTIILGEFLEKKNVEQEIMAESRQTMKASNTEYSMQERSMDKQKATSKGVFSPKRTIDFPENIESQVAMKLSRADIATSNRRSLNGETMMDSQKMSRMEYKTQFTPKRNSISQETFDFQAALKPSNKERSIPQRGSITRDVIFSQSIITPPRENALRDIVLPIENSLNERGSSQKSIISQGNIFVKTRTPQQEVYGARALQHTRENSIAKGFGAQSFVGRPSIGSMVGSFHKVEQKEVDQDWTQMEDELEDIQVKYVDTHVIETDIMLLKVNDEQIGTCNVQDKLEMSQQEEEEEKVAADQDDDDSLEMKVKRIQDSFKEEPKFLINDKLEPNFALVPESGNKVEKELKIENVLNKDQSVSESETSGYALTIWF